MKPTFTTSKACRTVLAITLVSLAVTSVHASIFGELFAQKQARESSGDPGLGHGETTVSQTANDEFAQRAKEVVSSVATDVLPETVSLPSTVDHDINGIIGNPSHIQDQKYLPKRGGGTAEDSVSNEVDPGLGDHVESSDRVANVEEPPMSAPGSAKPQKMEPEQLDMSKAIAGSEDVPMADREASNLINNELEDVNRALGPREAVETSVSGSSTARKDEPVSAEMHAALKSRVETALASLSGVYDALLHSGILITKTADTDTVEHTTTVVKRAPVAVPVHQEVPAISPEPESKNETAISEYGDTPSERAADTAAHEREVDGSQAKSGFATAVLSVFAGLVFVAAVGLMIAGFAFSGRMHESNSHQPLYPPSGPSFV